MLTGGPFSEASTNKLVIDDFSPTSVQKFINFIYSWNIEDQDAADLDLLMMVRKLFLKCRQDLITPALKVESSE